jgi:hypothetical protein
MTVRQFRLWWEFATFEERRDLVKRWFDSVITSDHSLIASERAAGIHFEDLPIGLVNELSHDKLLEAQII